MLTFYAGFALMGLSAYGMIVAPATESAVSAGRRYLAWTIAGELAQQPGPARAVDAGHSQDDGLAAIAPGPGGQSVLGGHS